MRFVCLLWIERDVKYIRFKNTNTIQKITIKYFKIWTYSYIVFWRKITHFRKEYLESLFPKYSQINQFSIN